MAATMNVATFMRKNFLDNQNSIQNSSDLTLKNMLDITKKLMREQEEIVGVVEIRWGKIFDSCHWLVMKPLSSTRKGLRLFRLSCLGRVPQHLESNEAWKRRIEWTITDQSYRDYDGIKGEPIEFEW